MATVKIIPYIDIALLEQQKAAVEKAKQEQLAQSFQDALHSASQALARLNALEEAARASADTRNAAAFAADSGGTAASSAIPASGFYSSAAASAPLNAELAAECPADLLPYFESASAATGVDVNLLLSIAKAESSFSTTATSPSGAMGIMQLMPFTAEEYGVSDAYSAAENIPAGAKLIANLLAKYNGDISLALAAYNAGSGSVEKYNGIPPFTETQDYVKKVLAYYGQASL